MVESHNKISPAEYARMKDEYSDEEYMQEQTQKATKTIMEVTGLSMEQIEAL